MNEWMDEWMGKWMDGWMNKWMNGWMNGCGVDVAWWGAAPEIWTNWDDFLVKSEAFTAAVQAIDTSSPDGLGTGLAAIGASCKSCHRIYRIK